MERTKAHLVALYSAALTAWILPAVALAQAGAQGASPGSGASPANAPTTNSGGASTGGGAGWLWVIAALVVLAIIWWAMSARHRRSTVTR